MNETIPYLPDLSPVENKEEIVTIFRGRVGVVTGTDPINGGLTRNFVQQRLATGFS